MGRKASLIWANRFCSALEWVPVEKRAVGSLSDFLDYWCFDFETILNFSPDSK
jgi:hypothetical protein